MLQIYDPRERALVRVADVLLRPLGWWRRRSVPSSIRRVLLLRLERIGDLLMVLGAVDDVRRAWPDAEIDLAVGEWNRALASLIPGVDRVEVATAPWLARAERSDGWRQLVVKASRWRRRRYDLAINFEPDIRSNLLAWLSGAVARVGYSTGGGGSLLTDAALYRPDRHVDENARDLVARAAGRHLSPARYGPRLSVPPAAARHARARLGAVAHPLIGIHVSGGRESKQWHLDRFAAVARTLADRFAATIVLTGAAGDRPLVETVRAHLAGAPIVDVAGATDLIETSALLAELDLFVSSDTGPMHLAAAVGTPVVALFGPSDPSRYGPISDAARVVRVSLPCSPCGQVRLPPERCRGHVPDCMDGITVAAVVAAAEDLLSTTARRSQSAAR